MTVDAAMAAFQSGADTGPAVIALHAAEAAPEIELAERKGGYSVAVFGSDRTYRYLLFCRWGEGPVLTAVGLNPSTATAKRTDATWARVTTRARTGWPGYRFGAAAMVNLHALISTSPAGLATHPDPVGPGNDACLRAFCQPWETVIAAWGEHRAARARAAEVTGMLRAAGVDLLCLGTNRDGSPKHPGRLAYSVPVQPWRPA